jgi:hypothetical protein
VEDPVEASVPRQVAQRAPRLLVGEAEVDVQPPGLGDSSEERLDDGIRDVDLVVEGELCRWLH